MKWLQFPSIQPWWFNWSLPNFAPFRFKWNWKFENFFQVYHLHKLIFHFKIWICWMFFKRKQKQDKRTILIQCIEIKLRKISKFVCDCYGTVTTMTNARMPQGFSRCKLKTLFFSVINAQVCWNCIRLLFCGLLFVECLCMVYMIVAVLYNLSQGYYGLTADLIENERNL